METDEQWVSLSTNNLIFSTITSTSMWFPTTCWVIYCTNNVNKRKQLENTTTPMFRVKSYRHLEPLLALTDKTHSLLSEELAPEVGISMGNNGSVSVQMCSPTPHQLAMVNIS